MSAERPQGRTMGNTSKNPFRNAFNGIITSYRSERTLRIHAASALATITLGIIFDVTREEWCWIASAIALVVMAELINTAIETAVDLSCPSEHPLARKAKDAAAGAVLFAAFFAAVVGSVIFLPTLWSLFFG